MLIVVAVVVVQGVVLVGEAVPGQQWERSVVAGHVKVKLQVIWPYVDRSYFFGVSTAEIACPRFLCFLFAADLVLLAASSGWVSPATR